MAEPLNKHSKKASTIDRYHHGDLRSALLVAAESVLTDKGLTGFTLRECARRAGVSHAAPAHHFKDVTGLFTAMAVEAFMRLNSELTRRQESAAPDARATFKAIGIGYISFAAQNPQHFSLMFQSHLLNNDDASLAKHSRQAFLVLSDAIATLHKGFPQTPAQETDVLIAWSVVHGFAQLYLDGQLNIKNSSGDDKVELTDIADRITNRLLDLFPT